MYVILFLEDFGDDKFYFLHLSAPGRIHFEIKSDLDKQFYFLEHQNKI